MSAAARTGLGGELQRLPPLVAALESAIGVAVAADGMPEQETVELATTLAFWSPPAGPGRSLRAKLEAVLHAVERDQPDVAIRPLRAFVNEVRAQRGKGLSPSQADYLTAAATRIVGLLERAP